MKYRVVKKFVDKYTKRLYEVGTILELEKERAEEILSVDKLIVKVRTTK